MEKLIKKIFLCLFVFSFSGCRQKTFLYFPDSIYSNGDIVVSDPSYFEAYTPKVSFKIGFIEAMDGFNGEICLSFVSESDEYCCSRTIGNIKKECQSLYSDDWLNSPRPGGYTYIPDYLVTFPISLSDSIDTYISKIVISIYEESNSEPCYSLTSTGLWNGDNFVYTSFNTGN